LSTSDNSHRVFLGKLCLKQRIFLVYLFLGKLCNFLVLFKIHKKSQVEPDIGLED
jgi:hypothetical protein